MYTPTRAACRAGLSVFSPFPLPAHPIFCRRTRFFADAPVFLQTRPFFCKRTRFFAGAPALSPLRYRVCFLALRPTEATALLSSAAQLSLFFLTGHLHPRPAACELSLSAPFVNRKPRGAFLVNPNALPSAPKQIPLFFAPIKGRRPFIGAAQNLSPCNF